MSAARVATWLPGALLVAGAAVVRGPADPRAAPLRAPLESAVPLRLASHEGHDVTLPPAARRAAGFDDYLVRVYGPPGAAGGAVAFSVYIGYYPQQLRGRSIHSPKNCLPGNGWEPLASRRVAIETAAGPVTVNRYLIQRESERALVLYWYQGRGRVESNEYVVKWDLLRDAALTGRTEEALVRVVVPITTSEADAFRLAARAAAELVPAVFLSLPA